MSPLNLSPIAKTLCSSLPVLFAGTVFLASAQGYAATTDYSNKTLDSLISAGAGNVITGDNVSITSPGSEPTPSPSNRYEGVYVYEGGEASFGGDFFNVEFEATDGTHEFAGVQVNGNAFAEFSSQSVNIDVEGPVSSGKWGFGLLVNGTGGASAHFTGGDVRVSTTTTNYTSQSVTVKAGSKIQFDNAGDVTIEAYSPFGVTVVDGYGTLVFNNTGDVSLIGEILPGTQTAQTNVVGMQGTNGSWTVSSNVENFSIRLTGAGVDNDGTTYSTGTHGINAGGSQAQIKIDSKTFNINMDVGADVEDASPGEHTARESYGIWLDDGGKMVVGSGTQTSIKVDTGLGSSCGATVFSGAELTFEGNTSITATGVDKAVAVSVDGKDPFEESTPIAESSITFQGQQNSLTGDVEVANQGSAAFQNGATKIQGNVTVDATSSMAMSGADVAVEGKVTNEGALTLAESSNLTLNGDGSSLGNVTADDSSVSLGSGTYTMGTFAGTGKSLIIDDIANTSVTIAERQGDLQLTGTSSANDQYANAQEAAEALTKAVTITDDDAQGSKTVVLDAGKVNDSLTGVLDAEGNLTDVRITKNQTLASYGEVAMLGVFQWRHDMNDLTKRMGELRDSPQGVGAWARVYGSEQEYGGAESTNTSIQVGSDFDVGAGWKVGGAFTYTDGSSDFSNGTADHEAYGFALYGTWLADNGQFVDLIAKYSRLDTDFDIGDMDGSFDNNAWSVSAEYGWHIKLSDLAFVEPQAELTYGMVLGDDIRASNDVRIEQDDFTSFIGRLGVRGGFYFPQSKGNIYARFSVLHDFDGDMESKATYGKAANTVKDDIGGTWVEYGVGANFNWTDRTYTYVDLERNSGGEVRENWRWNVGVRHVF